MKRLLCAAFLAAGLHALAFWIQVPRSRPLLPLQSNRAVDIDLSVTPRPAAKSAAPAPEKIAPQPEPPPRPESKPVPKPAPGPSPPKPSEAEAVASEPVPVRPLQPEPAAPPAAAIAQPPVAPPAASETGAAVPAQDLSQDLAQAEDAQDAVQVSRPLYDLNPPPVYPRVARRRSYQGTVLLDVRVTADGRAAEVRLARSSGHAVLDRSALEAVRGWRFAPARRGTLPLETWVQVPVRFELK